MMFEKAFRNLVRRDEKKPLPQQTAPIPTSKIVYIIADAPDVLQMADQTYEGCEVKASAGYQLSLETLVRASPHLILLDPEILDANGTRLASRLLAAESLLSVPIIALVEGESNQRNYPRFDGCMSKPVDVDSFTSQIQGFLSAVEQNGAQGGKEPANYEGGAPQILAAIHTGLPGSQFTARTGFALQSLCEALEGKSPIGLSEILKQAQRLVPAATARSRIQFASAIRFCSELMHREPDPNAEIVKLRSAYIRHYSNELANLQSAVLRKDCEFLAMAGHRLKGNGAAYGFAELTDIGKDLSVAARRGEYVSAEELIYRIGEYIGLVQLSVSLEESTNALV